MSDSCTSFVLFFLPTSAYRPSPRPPPPIFSFGTVPRQVLVLKADMSKLQQQGQQLQRELSEAQAEIARLKKDKERGAEEAEGLRQEIARVDQK